MSRFFHEVAEPGDAAEMRGSIGLPFSWAPEDGGPVLLVGAGGDQDRAVWLKAAGASMATAYFVTHPEVVIDPAVPVPDWGLSPRGFERIAAFCCRDLLDRASDVFTSGERKAVDCAEALRVRRGLPFTVEAGLGENDRSSTGYVAPPRFWEIVDAFFAHPEGNVLGWETALDAQTRVAGAVGRCIAGRAGRGNVVIVSHGGVGTLLLCRLLGMPISKVYAQPIAGGGCFFAFETETLGVLHGWRDMVPQSL